MGQSGELVHNFNKNKKYSYEDEEFWNKAYRQAFPGMVSHTSIKQDCSAQRLGVDRVIVLGSGEIIKVDEKKRRGVYDDILLEYVSNDQKETPGWMEKDLTIDYLAYAFMPSKKVYFFPWIFLKRAWNSYRDKWIEEYGTIRADNGSYTTLSVAVPIKVLQKAIKNAMIVTLEVN